MSVTAQPQPIGQNRSGNVAARKLTNTVMLTLCMLAAALAIFVLGLVLFFLMSKGLRYMSWHLFTRVPDNVNYGQGGIQQSIFGTLTLIVLASVIGLPLGILGGIYQLEQRGRFASMVRFFTDVLNGVPSIVIGIFAYAAVVVPDAAVAHPGPAGLQGLRGRLRARHHDDPDGHADHRGDPAPRALRLARGVAGPGRDALADHVERGAADRARRRHHRHHAGPGAHRRARPPRCCSPSSAASSSRRTKSAPLTVPTLNAPIDALPLRIYNYSQVPTPELNNFAWAGAIILISLILILSIAARYATRSNLLEEK